MQFNLINLPVETGNGADIKTCSLFDRDSIAKLKLLRDTEAEMSVIPSSNVGKVQTCHSSQLYAANGSKIKTFGEKVIQLDLQLR